MNESARASGLSFGARVMALALVFMALGGRRVSAQQAGAPLSADQATAIATEAYIYGYPLGHGGDDSPGRDKHR